MRQRTHQLRLAFFVCVGGDLGTCYMCYAIPKSLRSNPSYYRADILNLTQLQGTANIHRESKADKNVVGTLGDVHEMILYTGKDGTVRWTQIDECDCRTVFDRDGICAKNGRHGY